MSDMTLFEGNSLVSSDLFKELTRDRRQPTGGSGGIKSHESVCVVVDFGRWSTVNK